MKSSVVNVSPIVFNILIAEEERIDVKEKKELLIISVNYWKIVSNRTHFLSFSLAMPFFQLPHYLGEFDVFR